MVSKLVFANLRHRPVRTFLTVAAIGLQVTMILTLVGLSEGTVESSAKRTRGTGADLMVRPPNSAAIGLSSAPMPEQIVDKIASQPHVALATGTVVQTLGFLDVLVGVNLDKMLKMSGGLDFVEGGPFKNPHEAILDELYAKQRKTAVGQTIQLLNTDYKVAGIFRSGKLARAMIDIKELQSATANTGKITQVYVKVDNPARTDAVVAQLKELLPGYIVISMDEFLSQITTDTIPMLKSFTRVIIGLSVIFGFLVVFLAMYTAILERTREIGILKALGAAPPYIVGLLVTETAILAAVGVVFGILLTYGTRFVVETSYPATLTQSIVPLWWPIAGAIALVGACLGAVYPGLKAARQDAIEALTYE